MAAGGHFLFELIKISLLSAVYGTIVFFIIWLIRRNKIKSRKHLYRYCFTIVYCVLFVFMFTYWGDHGFGDDSIIPISNHQTVNESDETAYIEISRKNQIEIGKFNYDDKFLYAEVANKAQINGDYMIWDLQTDQGKIYTAVTYLAMSKSGHAVSPARFKDFFYFYNRYWNGWRFWLLP